MPPKTRQNTAAPQHGAQSQRTCAEINLEEAKEPLKTKRKYVFKNSKLATNAEPVIKKARFNNRPVTSSITVTKLPQTMLPNSNIELQEVDDKIRFDKRVVLTNNNDNDLLEPDAIDIENSEFSAETSVVHQLQEQVRALIRLNSVNQEQIKKQNDLNSELQHKLWANSVQSHSFGVDSNYDIPQASSTSRDAERAQDRMLKNIPKFRGESDENFTAWVMNAQIGLKLGAVCSESEKIEAILIKVEGCAREILGDIRLIQRVEDIFDKLNKTFGLDQRTLLANTKQNVDESVKVYSNRLRTYLNLLDIGTANNAKSDIVCLDYFIKGLSPSLASKVSNLLPKTFEDAENYALQLEAMGLLDNKKTLLNKKEKVERLNYIKSSDSSATVAMNTEDIFEKLSVMQKKIDDHTNSFRSLKDKVTTLSETDRGSVAKETRQGNRNYRNNESNSRNDNNRINNQRQSEFRGYCMGCKKFGHRYTDCKSITKEEMEDINRNFPEKLQEMRDFRNNMYKNSLNSKGATGTTQ